MYTDAPMDTTFSSERLSSQFSNIHVGIRSITKPPEESNHCQQFSLIRPHGAGAGAEVTRSNDVTRGPAALALGSEGGELDLSPRIIIDAASARISMGGSSCSKVGMIWDIQHISTLVLLLVWEHFVYTP